MIDPHSLAARVDEDDVPGVSRMLGERRSSNASATFMGIASSESTAKCGNWTIPSLTKGRPSPKRNGASTGWQAGRRRAAGLLSISSSPFRVRGGVARPCLSAEARALSRLAHSSRLLRRSALEITDTELRDIARAATMGLSRMPNAG